MSDDKNKAGDIAKHIWLAGVGAYGRAVEEAQGRIEKAMEPPKMFRDLVKAGAALEEEARESTVAARQSVEERIGRVRDNFHNQRPVRMEEIEQLQKKVDQLTRKVNQLTRALADEGVLATKATKTSRKKVTKKKATSTRLTPAPKKKSAKKKTPAKKAPAIRSRVRAKKSAKSSKS